MWDQISGGGKLIAWFGGEPNFQSAELVELSVHRDHGAVVRFVATTSCAGPRRGEPFKHAAIALSLKDVAEVALKGFGPPNVLGGLSISACPPLTYHNSLVGIGIHAPKHRVTLEPCAGAFGTIDATVVHVSVEDVDDNQEAT